MENNLCIHCKKRLARTTGEICLNYKGFLFTILMSGFECGKCAANRYIDNFNGYVKNLKPHLVLNKNGKIEVNWSLYYAITTGADGYVEKNCAINSILKSLGIFAYIPDGNYEIVGCGLCLNPSITGGYYYFTRKEDAIGYAKAKLSDAYYPWEVRKVQKIL